MITQIVLSDASMRDESEPALAVELSEALGTVVITVCAMTTRDGRVEREPVLGTFHTGGGDVQRPIEVAVDFGDLGGAIVQLSRAASRDERRRAFYEEIRTGRQPEIEQARLTTTIKRNANRIDELTQELAEREAELATLRAAAPELAAGAPPEIRSETAEAEADAPPRVVIPPEDLPEVLALLGISEDDRRSANESEELGSTQPGEDERTGDAT